MLYKSRFKNIKQLQIGSLSIVAVMLLFLTGCTNNLEDDILGKWSDGTPKESLEFFEDKSMILQTRKESIPGTWIVIEDGKRIKFNIKGAFGLELSGTAKYFASSNEKEDFIEMNFAGKAGKAYRMRNIQDVIVGKWSNSANGVAEFFEGGEVVIEERSAGNKWKKIPGSWSVVEDGIEVEAMVDGEGKISILFDNTGLHPNGERYIEFDGAKLNRVM